MFLSQSFDVLLVIDDMEKRAHALPKEHRYAILSPYTEQYHCAKNQSHYGALFLDKPCTKTGVRQYRGCSSVCSWMILSTTTSTAFSRFAKESNLSLDSCLC